MEKIICFVSCLLCAFPMFIIGYFNRNSREPITFWSGDKSLKEKVRDVKGYNEEMSGLYIKCAFVFLITGIVCIIHVGTGVICILAECTVGIYLAWRVYKGILARHEGKE